MNHLVNPITRGLLRSPLHGLLSKSTVLVTYTGRRTGITRTVPVNYILDSDDRLLVTSLRRRQWWRSLQGGAPVGVRLAGVDRTGSARILDLGIADRGAAVARQLHELAGRTLTPIATRERVAETVVIAIDLDGGHEAADQPHNRR